MSDRIGINCSLCETQDSEIELSISPESAPNQALEFCLTKAAPTSFIEFDESNWNSRRLIVRSKNIPDGQATVTLSEEDISIVDNFGAPLVIFSKASTDNIVRSSSESSSFVSLEPCNEISTPRSQNIIGILAIEISKLENLTSARQKVFLVVTFGKRSFRTRVVDAAQGAKWNEWLCLPISEKESDYQIFFSLYTYNKWQSNKCLGKCELQISSLVKQADVKHSQILPINDSYNLHTSCSAYTLSFAKRMFWKCMARHFDTNGNGTVCQEELGCLLQCVGPELSDESERSIKDRLIPESNGEYSYDTIGKAFEILLLRPTVQPDNDGCSAIVGECPICTTQFENDLIEADILIHTLSCLRKNTYDRIENEMMGGFITEEHASRKWISRLFSFFGFGGYGLGKNNGNIFVQDRISGKLIEEKMPNYIRLGIRLMYQNGSRAADSAMVRRLLYSMTIKQGKKFSSPESVNEIPGFIKFHNLNIDEILDPISSFKSFNEFFYRKLKPECRPAASLDPNGTLCPADCRLVCYPTIDKAAEFWIKGSNFTVSSLLGDSELGGYFDEGGLAVCRLAPQDYHRFHCPFEAKVVKIHHIPGAYFTVNPMAVRKSFNVFTENSRTVIILETPKYGRIAYVAIGAMMVGSILLSCSEGQHIKALDEVGYFAFGGSTIVLVFPPGAHHFESDLEENSHEKLETLVKVGQRLGHFSLSESSS